jgi:uncharacterized protein YjbJ (UPF0337 family)
MRARWLTRLRGRIQREVGEATGDRRVEAQGAATAELAEQPDEETVDRAEQRIRRKHGDVLARRPARRVRAGRSRRRT